jgi:flagellar assembly protein FliH
LKKQVKLLLLVRVEDRVMPSYSRIVKLDQTDFVSPFQVNSLNAAKNPASNVKPTSFVPDGLIDIDTVKKPTDGENGTTSGSTTQVEASLSSLHSRVLHKQNNPGTPKIWTFPDIARKTSSRDNKLNEPQRIDDYSYLLTEAKTRADEIIAEADRNATLIAEQAQIEAETLKQKAFMEGMTAARNEASQTMHQVERVIQETQLWQEQVMHQSQRKIIDMVIAIGRKLFGSGYELSPEQIDHIVSRAINEASRLGNLRIYLNPDDAKALVNLWQESELTVNGQQIQIVSSQNISHGGCFVDGQFGIVDGRVEEQVDQIMNSIQNTEDDQEVESETEEEEKE